MYCQNCGSEIADGIRFCNGCGSPVGTVAKTQPRPAPASSALSTRQLGTVMLFAALFLYCGGAALGYAFIILRTSYLIASVGFQLVLYLVVGIVGAWGVVITLRDRKTAMTVLIGGMLFRSAVALVG